MKNIRLVLLGELILFVIIFGSTLLLCGNGLSEITYYLDLISFLLIILVLIPGLLIMGVWKDFTKSFSVGIKHYSLLELKNIIGALDAAQKLTVYSAIFAILISAILILNNLTELTMLGPNMAVCILVGLYAAMVEFFLLPLKLNAERKLNEEMDFDNE